MNIKREKISNLLYTCNSLKNFNKLSISTKYKILKIEEILREEEILGINLIEGLMNRYGEGPPDELSRVKIKDEFVETVSNEIKAFNSQYIVLPDLYFSLDEFEKEELSWQDLETLMPFIK